jgi:hypothetical protein
MEAAQARSRLGPEDDSRSSEGMNYSAMRTPAQRPATAPMPLKSSDCSPSELAPHIVGTKPPTSIPKPAHMPMTERPMHN